MKIQTTFAIIIGMLSYGRELNTNGSQNLLDTKSGSKAHYRGGGWWKICCVGQDNPDVIRWQIKALKDAGTPCEICGKLALGIYCKECSTQVNKELDDALRGDDGYI